MNLKVGLFLVVLLAVLLIEPSFAVTRRNGGGARSVAQQRRNAPRARSIPRIPPIAPIRAPVSRRQPISRTPIRRRPQARPVVNSTPIRAPVAVPVAVPVAAPVPVPVPVPVPAPVAAPPAAVAQPSAVQSKAIAKDPKIVDGQPTQISAVPYLVRLRVDGSFNCGGTLVRPNIIVTAAHCVKGIRPGRITVEGGSTRLSTPGVIRPAWKIVTPRGFDSNSLNWDIAVIKLRQPMTGTNIQTIPFCSRALQPGQTALIAGWGTQSENSSQSSDQVRSTTIEMVAKNVCRNAYGSYDALSRTMICAGNRGRRDTCSGDSGGPLVVNRELCGVVSWGNGCGKAAYPGVYTSIRMVQNWINRAMRA